MTDDFPTVKQCKTCPWRVGADVNNIPGYSEDMHRRLDRTIQSGLDTLFSREHRVMACHYSKDGAEIPCAGWLHHQIGEGNNLAIRLGVMTGRYPVPEVDGEQHATFEATLPETSRRTKRKRKS